MKLFRLAAFTAFALVASHAIADEKPATATKAVPAIPLGAATPAPAKPDAKAETSHKLVESVEVKGDNGLKLQTLCMDATGRVIGLVAPAKPYTAPPAGTKATSEIHVFDADGKPVKKWTVDFHATAVNCDPEGTIYVAGVGKLARFDKDGKAIGEASELPHLTAAFKDKEALQKKAEEQLKEDKERMAQIYANARKSIADQLKRLEEKKPEDLTKTEERQIEQFKTLVKQYEKIEADYKGRTVEQVMEQMTGRMRIVNGIAASEKDIFLACGDIGYGYAVWRVSKDMKEAKQILSGIGGCCGQMDIQCHGPDVLVAENTKHRFARYDRDGKELGGFGKRGLDTDPSCFGGCCNPMNLRACGVGDIFTAESEGIIKRFGPSGEFIETAAVVKLSGGCKNVAVAVSPDAKKIYFCDLPGSKFHILEKK